MKRLCKYLKGSIPFVVLAPLFMLLEVMMDLMQPTMMADIIDVGVANGDMAYVLSSGIKMLGIAFAGFIGGAGCCVFSAIAGVSFGTRLRQGIFDKVQTFSFREIDRLKTSSLVTRLTNDVNQVQMMVMMLLKGLIRAPFSCIGGLIMALSFNGKLSLIFLAAMPVLAVVVVFIVRRSFPLFTRMQEKIDRVNTVMRENLLGVRVVKAFVTQDRERQRFESANEDLMNWSIKAQRITILLWPWVTLVTNLCIVALLWFGGNMAIAGEIETGKIMAFMTIWYKFSA
ncbi:MAG: ABC transporter permease [Oscillospiraceae bacterium]